MAKTIYTKRRVLLSHKLVEAREAANLTQQQVGKTGLISQSELSKIENGQRKVEFLTLLDLAGLYGKDMAFFTDIEQ
jgi:transcriptional regulator with XRE-family HTH domain